jgi:hypothetical protein
MADDDVTTAEAKARAEAERRTEAARLRAAALNNFEAAHEAIWAQATAVVNVKALIPIILDKATNTYTKWRDMFLTVLGKYALTPHVLDDATHLDRPVWVQTDCVVLSWIFATVSGDLQQSLMIRPRPTREAWCYLEDEFLGQKESRALLLETQFHNLRQDSMTITEFCRKLETMVASLAEFGDPIGDRQMVLTLLRGLSGKFRHMVSILKMQRPFPTFAEARTHLLLEEVDVDALPPSPPVALIASSPMTPAGGQGRHVQASAPSRTGQPGQSGGQRNGRRRGKGGRGQGSHPGDGQGGHGPPTGGHGASGGQGVVHPSFAHPWAGTLQMWPYGRPPPAPPAFAAVPQYGAPFGGAPAATSRATASATRMSTVEEVHPRRRCFRGVIPAAGCPLESHTWRCMEPGLPGAELQHHDAHPPAPSEWYADSGAGSHMTADAGKISTLSSPTFSTPSSIIVGNGALLPVAAIRSHTFSFLHRNLVLNNVLVSPHIIKNLISIHRFTTDNNCSIELDLFGLSVKDLETRNMIARCNSSSDLYPFFPPATSTSAFLAAPTSLWHRRLGHLGHEVLSKIISSKAISCNKDDSHHLCHACQLGRHTRLPFSSSNSRTTNNFDLIHCELCVITKFVNHMIKEYFLYLYVCTISRYYHM